MKLDIGSGEFPAEGWTTCDLFMPADIAAPAWDIPLDSESVEEVRMSHILEHLTPHDEALRTLAEVNRILMPSGLLWIEVPDIAGACLRYVSAIGEDRDLCMAAFYGDPKREGYSHHWGYDAGTLFSLIRRCGFEPPIIDSIWSHGMDCLYAHTFKP